MYASAIQSDPGRGGHPGGAAPLHSAPPRLHEEAHRAPGPTYSFAGRGKGNYVQECKYKYVGDGGGQFEMVPVRKKRPNHTLFFGLAGSAAIIGLLCFAFVQSHATAMARARAEDRRSHELRYQEAQGSLTNMTVNSPKLTMRVVSTSAPVATQAPVTTTTVVITTTDPYSDVPKFACAPQGLDPGSRIQAAADIAFKPAGLVEEGALGTVIVDGPVDAQNRPEMTPAERVVVVSWDGIPGLRHSRVTRDMIIRAMVVDDEVEALVDTVYVAEDAKAFPPAQLSVADLVRATGDLGGVRTGTFGTVVAGPDDKESWRVSAHSRVVVSFMGQLATMKVLETHVRKAPQVGELVRATVSVGEAEDLLPKDTIGVVTDVQTGDNGGEFGFVVDWRDHGTSKMKESQLEILRYPEGVIIPTGTKGKVLLAKSAVDKSVAKSVFIVAWDGFNGPGAVIERRHLQKVDEWQKGKADWCCGEEDAGCDKVNGTVSRYRCDRGAPQDWSLAKATWCCKHKDHGCKAAAGLVTEPPPTTRRFDPAPHTGVTTLLPNAAQ